MTAHSVPSIQLHNIYVKEVNSHIHKSCIQIELKTNWFYLSQSSRNTGGKKIELLNI